MKMLIIKTRVIVQEILITRKILAIKAARSKLQLSNPQNFQLQLNVKFLPSMSAELFRLVNEIIQLGKTALPLYGSIANSFKLRGVCKASRSCCSSSFFLHLHLPLSKLSLKSMRFFILSSSNLLASPTSDTFQNPLLRPLNICLCAPK